MDDIRLDSGFIELFKTHSERQLRPQASCSTVVNVASDQKKVHVSVKAELNDILKGVKCCLPAQTCDLRVELGKPCERTVQMKICSVYKSESHSDYSPYEFKP